MQHQQQVLGAIERAKQVTPPEMNSIIRVGWCVCDSCMNMCVYNHVYLSVRLAAAPGAPVISAPGLGPPHDGPSPHGSVCSQPPSNLQRRTDVPVLHPGLALPLTGSTCTGNTHTTDPGDAHTSHGQHTPPEFYCVSISPAYVTKNKCALMAKVKYPSGDLYPQNQYCRGCSISAFFMVGNRTKNYKYHNATRSSTSQS